MPPTAEELSNNKKEFMTAEARIEYYEKIVPKKAILPLGIDVEPVWSSLGYRHMNKRFLSLEEKTMTPMQWEIAKSSHNESKRNIETLWRDIGTDWYCITDRSTFSIDSKYDRRMRSKERFDEELTYKNGKLFQYKLDENIDI